MAFYLPLLSHALHSLLPFLLPSSSFSPPLPFPSPSSPPLQFNSAPQMNPNVMFSQPHVFYQGAGLIPQGQPMLPHSYPAMFHQQMVLGAGAPPRQQVVMFPHPQFPPGAHVPAMAYGGARHDLPTAQAPSQKYHQQPQQPSTQLQPKAQSTTKRATKALLIVDPDTNKPLDLEQLQELPTRQCLTNSLSSKVIKNYIQYVMQQVMQILGTCSSVVSQSCNNCTCLGHFTSLQLYIHVHTFTLSRVLL